MFTVNPFSASRSYKVLTKPENFCPRSPLEFYIYKNSVHQFSPPWQSAEQLPTHSDKSTASPNSGRSSDANR